MSPNPPIGLLRVPDYAAGGLEPSVAQPPLPLHEFLPLQPLSLALQPPLPLQEFWPLQPCFSVLSLSLSFLSLTALIPALPCPNVSACSLAVVPVSRPASAAPATKA